mmetsp:Transcript_4867/g.6963  ORF Transcript_4867/g.6963 Transcript_4867/m.6963 type:complete len:170 (-) Transcript_4867:135-644(-)
MIKTGRICMLLFAIARFGCEAFVGPAKQFGPSPHPPSSAKKSSSVVNPLHMSQDPSSEEIRDPNTTAEALSKNMAHPEAIYNIHEHIAKILPHRYPFALVDKVIYFEPGKRAVGVKCITNNEPQFTGHFPDRPIMPGVLQIEAMAQLGGIIALQEPISDGKGTFFLWRR